MRGTAGGWRRTKRCEPGASDAALNGPVTEIAVGLLPGEVIATTNSGLLRSELLKNDLGVGYCNITKCCTEVCPEHIAITDNAIIPLKERVVDQYYDPVLWVWRKIAGKS